ncbi:unnamed protein product [Ostreobium quekettii]|uniref:aminodeoxychorismate synthase n=1 Tax=Ostreobium quekettii TaxID=121088 RepID=A0A8S1IRE7_9CHLO|nr:unnamed protein product [Ostreobium quekettii]|eukprot:evm.model.scf_1811EXC.3 EVM.evm.TU.scf_1811EXC.3   scf_1811EXC:8103-13358(-)
MGAQEGRRVKTLIIDNYDSYTYNLFQLVGEVNGEAPTVIRNDDRTVQELRHLHSEGGFDNIVISPGPGTPYRQSDIGVCGAVFEEFADVPILGVCMGHQILAHVHGGAVVRAPEPVHGRVSEIRHSGHPLFHGIPSGQGSGFKVVRYHSLVVEEATLPFCIQAIAWTAGALKVIRPPTAQNGAPHRQLNTTDALPMAVAHRTRPHMGVQFHPESVGTAYGMQLLQNFRDITVQNVELPAVKPTVNRVGPRELELAPLSWPVDAQGWKGNLVVEWKRCAGVLQGSPEEPTELFHGLFGAANVQDTFWLDSAATDRGRFSFMGGPGGALWRRITYRLSRHTSKTGCPGNLQVMDSHGNQQSMGCDLWDYLESCLADLQIGVTDDLAHHLPFNFWGGFVGYFGYELKALSEGTLAHCSSLPDSALFFADRLVAVDHKCGDVYAIAIRREMEASAESLRWLDATKERVMEILEKGGTCHMVNGSNGPTVPAPNGGAARNPDFALVRDRATYMENINACMAALNAGESYEICLTNAYRRGQGGLDPWRLYSVLRKSNPAPYGAWLSFGDGGPQVCCSSPERFLRGDRGGVLEARPIKGTCARHADPALDRQAAQSLATSEKEQAENLMIVDLLRNDLGRVSEVGSVHVPGLMEVESYATVHQLVSTVRGIRRRGKSMVECIRAAFPGGSMTGAPKIRSMEILDELEAAPRGVYSGAIGYLSVNDTFDLNIVIRTAVVHRGAITVGAGGAIVALSDAAGEYEEMTLKARALLNAALLSERQFGAEFAGASGRV